MALTGRLALALKCQSRSAGQRCPRPGRVAHGFRKPSPTRTGLLWHKDWHLPPVVWGGGGGQAAAGGFIPSDYPGAQGPPLRLTHGGVAMDGEPTFSTRLFSAWTVGKL